MSQVKHHVTGAGYWRSLEQLADTPEIRELVSREFPGYDADSIASSSRRSFLKIMGAGMALAGLTLTGCRRWPKEKLAPYAANPAGRIPGIPEQYATAFEVGGHGQGLLVTSFDGRPIKVEGNPSHPMSRVGDGWYGASTSQAQASVLDLYDPLRRVPVTQRDGERATPSSWDAFAEAIRGAVQANPAGFAVLSEATASPSVMDMRQRLAKAFPQVKWFEYEAASRDNEREGARMAFGQPLRELLHLEKADVVVCLDADPLGDHPAHVRYSADWAERRRLTDPNTPAMSRVYVAESTFSNTGASADVRVGVRPDRVYLVARAIAAGLGVSGVQQDQLTPAEQKFVQAAVADLKRAGNKGVVTAGAAASPATHALAHAINAKVGAVGNTVTLHADPAAGDRPTHVRAIADLAGRMNGGQVSTLLILGGNPVYDAPADVNFAAALAKVPFSAHLSLFENETSLKSKWFLPRAHYLESWGDARAWDGTATIAQPLIEPLFGGRSPIEVLALVAGDELRAGDAIVRRTWGGTFKTDLEYRRALEAGVVQGSAFPAAQAAVQQSVNYPAVEAPPEGTWVVRLDAHPMVYDGRFAHNGWLQETPDPLSKLVWDNAAMLAKKDADALGVVHGGLLRVETPTGQSVDVPAFVLPGQPLGVIGLTLGYGRTAAGAVGTNVGFDTYAIRTTAAPSVIVGAKVGKVGTVHKLATTQEHHILEDLAMSAVEVRAGEKGKSGKLVREASLAEYKADPKLFQRGQMGIPLQIFEPPMKFTQPHAWGMTIDMNACTGCGGCQVACMAENNIPVVGKTEVLRSREMNWIRVDRYFKGDVENNDVEVVQQVMMCVHCENAPCEQVCPVAATVHDSEGLNTMVYNRCIGTRYCSNNCPYKVRRFNYFDYHSRSPRDTFGMPYPGMPDEQQNEQVDKIKRMVFNPEVTVRMRGVMEKCTYCVQRIHNTTIAKRASNTPLKDGEILTACQQACPTQAIVFGDLNDPNSRVSRLQKNNRSYQVLEELNTRARTRYLAKVRNRAEEVAGAPADVPAGSGAHHG